MAASCQSGGVKSRPRLTFHGVWVGKLIILMFYVETRLFLLMVGGRALGQWREPGGIPGRDVWCFLGGQMASTIFYEYNNLKFMENQFANLLNDQSFYQFFPFVHYYCPKIYNAPNILNSAEDSTLQLPHSPSAFSSAVQPSQTAPESQEASSVRTQQQSKKSSKAVRNGKTNRRNAVDQYRPYERQEKKKSNCLKENRNVLPIKIRQMLSFLTREKKSHEIIQKFIAQSTLKTEFNQKRFYAFLKMKKQKIGNYVTLSILKNFLGVEPEKVELYCLGQQAFYLKIVRVLFRYYLQNTSILCSLTSNRIQNEQKLEHVSVQRQLMDFLEKAIDY